MISFVILILIAFASAMMVYGWLKYYPNMIAEETDCKEGTSLIIQNAACSLSEQKLEIVLKNNSRDRING
jgi:hypothetical protein